MKLKWIDLKKMILLCRHKQHTDFDVFVQFFSVVLLNNIDSLLDVMETAKQLL